MAIDKDNNAVEGASTASTGGYSRGCYDCEHSIGDYCDVRLHVYGDNASCAAFERRKGVDSSCEDIRRLEAGFRDILRERKFERSSKILEDCRVEVTKRTDEELVRLAAGFTSGHESKIALKKAYKSEHSIIRSQIYTIECYNIPLFVSTHLIRHHVGSQPFQLTCREDRQGGSVHFAERVEVIKRIIECGDVVEACNRLDWLVENADRNTRVNLLLIVNAQSLIDMAKLRLCRKASPETRDLFRLIRAKVAEADPDLAPFLVPKCVYRGGICGEPRSCGYNRGEAFKSELEEYKKLFTV